MMLCWIRHFSLDTAVSFLEVALIQDYLGHVYFMFQNSLMKTSFRNEERLTKYSQIVWFAVSDFFLYKQQSELRKGLYGSVNARISLQRGSFSTSTIRSFFP